MALRNKSLILYGLQVTENNRSIDFKSSGGGSQISATLNIGYYSLTDLATEVARAMNTADTANVYTCTVDRTISGGTQNRITIATNGAFLSLLWASGTRSASAAASLLGFAATDRTGALTYTGTTTCGTTLVPDYVGYNYSSPTQNKKLYGAVNISANGTKETVVFQVQQFLEVEFKYEPEGKVNTSWMDFMVWAIQQRGFDFTPDITVPSTFYDVTLEKTEADGKGLGFKMMEMLPQFPFNYRTGKLTMRIRED